jgi:hypothetical protein
MDNVQNFYSCVNYSSFRSDILYMKLIILVNISILEIILGSYLSFGTLGLIATF